MDAEPCDISIVIPTYNRPHLLRETIDSVLAQTRPPREIIIVDNGTDDETAPLVEAYGGSVTYIKMEPLGVQAARNRGVQQASSKWVAMLDDDDLYHPDFLEQMAGALQDDRATIAFCDHVKWRDGIREPRTNFERAPDGYWDGIARPAPSSHYSFVGKFPVSRLLRFFATYASMIVIRKDLFDKIGGYDTRMRGVVVEDAEFIVRALNHGDLAIVWKPLIDYRIHSGGYSAGQRKQEIGRWQVFEFIRQFGRGYSQEFYAVLDRDLERRRARIFDVSFRIGDRATFAKVARMLTPADWTWKRKTKRIIGSLPEFVFRAVQALDGNRRQ